ncbi:NADH:flavin oxidoreductase/NADH oxidase [Microvirga sp. BT291]|nr:NADH:flavin oxidoreductase/NADH oxidase [Microvirga pudoricolor]
MLFSPIRLANADLPNRIVVAPMCQYSANDGCASDWHLTHLGSLANSGAGLVVVEATAVERRGRITHGDLGLYDDACEAALLRVVNHCRRIGTARMGVQIAHAGRKASTQIPWEGGQALGPEQDPWQTIAPSAMPYRPDWHTPREMTQEDIDRVREAHVDAARRALRIGFDEIELHAAHGYLLHEFLSPLTNKRTDRYGGSLEARMRFPLEIAQAVRAVWPTDKPLGIRITGSDWASGGIEVPDAVAFAKALEAVGIDFICVSSGGLVPEAKIAVGPNYQVPFAEAVKRQVSIPVRAVGLIGTPRQAEKIIAEGRADMVALARAFLDNPHWGWHAAKVLGGDVARPLQYARAAHHHWPAAFYTD